MDSQALPSDMSSYSRDGSPGPLPGASRRTSHTANQGGLYALGYEVGVVWGHLRPFIPFIMISCLVTVLVYLINAIVLGGPFKDPLFFVKFNERWPRPDPNQVKDTSSNSVPDPYDDHTGNGTI